MKAQSLVFGSVCAALLGGVGACAVDDEPYEVTVGEAEQAATQADVWQSTWNGGNANGWFWNATGSGWLDAYEYKTRDTRYAYLNFSTWAVDPTSQQCFSETWFGETYEWCWFTRYTYSYGWGSIDGNDAVLGPNSARVKTSLGDSFYGAQCTYDWWNWTFSCAPLSGGSVDVRWTRDGAYSFFSSGTSQASYGAYTFKTQGTYRSSSAQIVGSLLGIEILGGAGNVGDTRGVNVSKSVFQTPRP